MISSLGESVVAARRQKEEELREELQFHLAEER